MAVIVMEPEFAQCLEECGLPIPIGGTIAAGIMTVQAVSYTRCMGGCLERKFAPPVPVAPLAPPQIYVPPEVPRPLIAEEIPPAEKVVAKLKLEWPLLLLGLMGGFILVRKK